MEMVISLAQMVGAGLCGKYRHLWSKKQTRPYWVIQIKIWLKPGHWLPKPPPGARNSWCSRSCGQLATTWRMPPGMPPQLVGAGLCGKYRYHVQKTDPPLQMLCRGRCPGREISSAYPGIKPVFACSRQVWQHGRPFWAASRGGSMRKVRAGLCGKYRYLWSKNRPAPTNTGDLH